MWSGIRPPLKNTSDCSVESKLEGGRNSQGEVREGRITSQDRMVVAPSPGLWVRLSETCSLYFPEYSWPQMLL